MTSGKPFTPREDNFIKQNCNEQYPSLIARALVVNFTEDNGGERSTKAVSERMAYWVEQLNQKVEEQVKEPVPEPKKKRFDARKLNGKKSTQKISS